MTDNAKAAEQPSFGQVTVSHYAKETAELQRAFGVLKASNVGNGNGAVAPSPPPPELELNGREVAQGSFQRELEDLDNQDTVVDQHLQDYHDAIASVLPEDKEFIETFTNQPCNAFEAPDAPVEHIRNGHALPRDMSAFDKVYLVDDKEGIDIEVPDLTFENLHQFLDINETLPVIDCDAMIPKEMPLRQFLEAVADKKSKKRYNVLTLEFSQMPGLTGVCSPPKYVRELSMVGNLESKLKEEIKIVDERLKQHNTSERAQLKAEKKKCEELVANLPQYEKFLLLSMKDSFTDVHVDMAATAVFYHVIVGKKIFYVAPPTRHNIAVYKHYQLKGRDEGWLGQFLFDEFQKVEINAGNTALIPPGWIHFVYTPEHSIVFGGNYLLKSGMDLQSEFADFEVEEVHREHLAPAQTFEDFGNVMFAYAKYCVLPEDSAGDVFETKLLGELKKLLKRGKKKNKRVKSKNGVTWFKPAEQKTIARNLQARLGIEDVDEDRTQQEEEVKALGARVVTVKFNDVVDYIECERRDDTEEDEDGDDERVEGDGDMLSDEEPLSSRTRGASKRKTDGDAPSAPPTKRR